jgi:hypothetical protein
MYSHFPFSTLLLLLIIFIGFAANTNIAIVEACNICGCDDCTIADATAIVTFVYKDKKAKMACAPLQEKADVKTQIDDEYCRTNLTELARFTCKCYFTNGTLLEDAYSATIPPGENGTFLRYFGLVGWHVVCTSTVAASKILTLNHVFCFSPTTARAFLATKAPKDSNGGGGGGSDNNNDGSEPDPDSATNSTSSAVTSQILTSVLLLGGFLLLYTTTSM